MNSRVISPLPTITRGYILRRAGGNHFWGEMYFFERPTSTFRCYARDAARCCVGESSYRRGVVPLSHFSLDCPTRATYVGPVPSGLQAYKSAAGDCGPKAPRVREQNLVF